MNAHYISVTVSEAKSCKNEYKILAIPVLCDLAQLYY